MNDRFFGRFRTAAAFALALVGGASTSLAEVQSTAATAEETTDSPENCAARRAAQRAMLDVTKIEPVLRHYAGNERYIVYVVERECGGYLTKVCVRYRETGSRVWRNSCRRNVTRSMSFAPGPVIPLIIRPGWPGQNPPVHTNAMPRIIARRLESAFNVALNGDVTITDVEENGITAIYEASGIRSMSELTEIGEEDPE